MQARKCCQVICLEPLGQNCIAGDQRFHLYGVRQLVERLSCCLNLHGVFWLILGKYGEKRMAGCIKPCGAGCDGVLVLRCQ